MQSSLGNVVQADEKLSGSHSASNVTAGARQQFRPPLRVLHVIDRLGVGGAEQGIFKLLEGMPSGDFDQRVCTIHGFDHELARAHGLEGKIYTAARARPGLQFLVRPLVSIIREFRPHIVHSRNWGTIEAIPAARLARVPVSIHSEHGYEMDMIDGLPLRRRIARRAAYSAATAIFTVTQELRQYHARAAWISQHRLGVIRNGVDLERFAPRFEEREETRRQFRFGPDSLVIGTLGRLVPIKDHMTLLRAAEKAISGGTQLNLLLVGAGPEAERLQSFAAASPGLAKATKFVGATSYVPALLNAMDIFVLPSLNEGMSNTILEAMATAIPTVATEIGGNPEVLEHGRTGLLFRPADVSGLADVLRQLAANLTLRKSLGTAARDHVVRNFSLESMIQQYRKLYINMARKRGILAPEQHN